MPSTFSRILGGLLCGLSCSFGVTLSAQTRGVSAQEHARLANEYLQRHQPDKAIVEFQALVDANPLNLDAQANLGVLLYFQGQLQPAAEHLRAAVRINPGLSKIRALLGLSEAALSQSDAARDDLSRALPQLQEKALRKQVGLTLIEIDSAQLRLADASLAAQELLKSDPADPEILYAAYRIYTDLAGGSLLSLSLAAPNSGQMQQAIAHELLRVRDLPGAIRSFRRAILADPSLPGIHFELAEALHSSADNAERALAEQEYRIALDKNPHEVQAAVRLGDMRADRNDLDGAVALYQQALHLQPGNQEASVGLARVYTERGEREKALPLLEAAIAADPSDMLAHYRLSALYRSMQRPEDARRELAEYQRIKDLKDKLREVYSTMKLQAPGSADPESPGRARVEDGTGSSH